MKRQAWQRSMFAKELGFDPNTKDKAELATIDEKYEAMRQEVNEWNENQQRIMDRWVLAERKWMAGMISEEEYENIVHPDKRAIVRFPEDMGGHGDNFSLFYCTECKNEFCMINEKGEQLGTIIDKLDVNKILNITRVIESKRLCEYCTELEKERREFRDRIDKR
jgi:hypothetical protein